MAPPGDPFVLAHTAQCKLKLAADRPDRHLRFILGHALTLDNVTLRIVEIEEEQAAIERARARKVQAQSGERRVSFQDNSNQFSCARPAGELHPPADGSKRMRGPSPPPPVVSHSESESSEEELSDGEDLGLARFGSGSAQPPRAFGGVDLDSNEFNVDGSDSSDEEPMEPKSPPAFPSHDTLETIVEEEGDEELAELYESVRNCMCQDSRHNHEKAPVITKIWEIPQPEIKKRVHHGREMQYRGAVIQVSA